MGLVKLVHKGSCVDGRLEPVLHCDDLCTRKKTRARHILLQQKVAKSFTDERFQLQSYFAHQQIASSYQTAADSGSAHNEASTGATWSYESESGEHWHRHLSRQVLVSINLAARCTEEKPLRRVL